MSPRKRANRSKIISAAEHLFSTQGFRATTMERVAEEAGMSKVTLYGYFNDKDALFEAVALGLADRMRDRVAVRLKGSGSIDLRITNALIDKHDLIFEIVRHSLFASELFAAKDRVARAIFQQCDLDIEDLLAGALAGDGKVTTQLRDTARVLFSATIGVANRAKDRNQLRTDIKLLVRSVLYTTSQGDT